MALNTKLLIIACFALLNGCAIGQHSQYTGGFRFTPAPLENKPPIIVAVSDQRPSVLSGEISASNVGILRSLAGIPWAVHTSSGRPLAIDFGESIVQTLNQNGYGALLKGPDSDLTSVSGDGEAIYSFVIREWNNEAWFSQIFSYCVELALLNTQQVKIAQSNQCGRQQLGTGDPEFSDLATAVGTVIGRLINTTEMTAALRSYAVPKIDVRSTKQSKPSPTKATNKARCSVAQIEEMKKLSLSKDQILSACE